MYCTQDRQFVKKVQSIKTADELQPILQYSTLVDLVVHESFSTVPGVPFLLKHVHDGDNVELYMPNYGKPLHSFVRGLTDSQREPFCVQAILGLVTTCLHLQHNGLQHTDMKPSNILVGSRNEITLIDFNIVSSMHVHDDTVAWTDSIGTWNYCAPEMICSYKTCETSIVWTLGLLIAYIIDYFPLDNKRFPMTKKQLASRRHWKRVYDELQNQDAVRSLPLPQGHRNKMSKQLQYIFERCTHWEPSERITLYELHSMLYLHQSNGQLPPPLRLHTISWIADPTYTDPTTRQNAIRYTYELCDRFHKLDLFVRIVSWMDRLMLQSISCENVVACFTLAWMLQGEYVLNDDCFMEAIQTLVPMDLQTLMNNIIDIGRTLSWRLWEKTADVYYSQQNRNNVIEKLYNILLHIKNPYTMEQLSTSI